MGERQFFLKQPPAAPERTDCASSEYPGSDHAEAQVVYMEAMKDWWQINDTIYELMEASVDLNGKHFERDFEKMRSFKNQGWQNAVALFSWINSAFDDSGVEDQERLLDAKLFFS